MFVVHRSLLKHWKIQMFENLNRLSESANMKMFRSSNVSAGTHGHRPITSLVNAKQNFFAVNHFSSTPPHAPPISMLSGPNCFTMNHYTCRIWLSTLKLGGGGPSVV